MTLTIHIERSTLIWICKSIANGFLYFTLFLVRLLHSPLHTNEVLPKQSYKKSLKNAGLIIESVKTIDVSAVASTPSIIDVKKKSSSKKDKKKDKDDRKEQKKKKSSVAVTVDVSSALDAEPNLLGTPVKHHHHKKDKKDKKTKEKKPKDSKSGYEEAIGISTPSKEVY